MIRILWMTMKTDLVRMTVLSRVKTLVVKYSWADGLAKRMDLSRSPSVLLSYLNQHLTKHSISMSRLIA